MKINYCPITTNWVENEIPYDITLLSAENLFLTSLGFHQKNLVVFRGMYFLPWVLEIRSILFCCNMIGRDSTMTRTNQFFDTIFVYEKCRPQYCYIYLLNVCDVITPKVDIGGQFRKRFQNGTIVPPKLTNIWTKILLKYGFLAPLRIHRRTFWWHQPVLRYLE